MILSQINVFIDTPPTSKGVVLEDERGGCQYGTTLLHIGSCLSLVAYFFFFSESNAERQAMLAIFAMVASRALMMSPNCC